MDTRMHDSTYGTPRRGFFALSFIVRDATGQALGYCEEEPGRRSAATPRGWLERHEQVGGGRCARIRNRTALAAPVSSASARRKEASARLDRHLFGG
jgi:hypothetical protein